MNKFNWEEIEGFEWDEENKDKNLHKHNVTIKETEEVFFNSPQSTFRDKKHSVVEQRYVIVGKSNAGRLLIVFFTIRSGKIRIISARDQSRKERKKYEKAKNNT